MKKFLLNLMTIRVRAFIVIVLTTLVIIMFSSLAGVFFAKSSIEKSQETDLLVVADIADHFISSEIEILKLKAADVAESIAEAPETEWLEILEGQIAKFPEFIGMAVYNIYKKGEVVTGKNPASPDIFDDKYVIKAFIEDRPAFSSTISISLSDTSEKEVVFYLAVPLHETDNGTVDRLLVLTLPGMYFRELVSDFVIWETGHIFIDDAEGHIIANIRENWVLNRQNFLKLAEIDSQYAEIASVIKRIISGETGVGYFSLAGVPRLCAFHPIGASKEGWCLGIVAPLPESQLNTIYEGLIVVGIVSFILSVIAALIASVFIKKPFEEVAALKEVAETASQSKSAFLAGMSHEMRTPLNAVIGLSDLTLKNEALDDDAKSNLGKIYNAGNTLLNIVNDILDISKIEAGKLELIPNKYDTASLINDAVTQNILRIGEKPIKFILDIRPDLPTYLYGDELRIKQILSNLLSNAFKYTNEGTVELGIRSENEEGGETVWITAWVKDTGKGIRSEDVNKLFSDYAQLDTKANRKIEGTGLGLAITKKMVELMGGTITVESEYGKGSIFTIRIKQKYVTDTHIGELVVKNLTDFKYVDDKRKKSSQYVYIKMPYAKVLVVDDHLTNLDVAKGLMKPYEMQVDCVTSGQQTIDVIRAEKIKYNAIFMDHMMPGMDGIETTRRIREIGTDYAKNIPIIALTANAIVGNEEMFLNNGFQAFLSKPIDIMQMDFIIKQWVRDKTQEIISYSDSPNKIQETSAGMPEISGVDVQKGLDMFAGNIDTYISVLRSYAQNTPAISEKLRAVTAENLFQYAIDVHGLKGSSASIGAEDIKERGLDLETKAKAGDLQGVLELNDVFLRDVQIIVENIKAWLNLHDKAGKPRLNTPNPVVLEKLRQSLIDCDMNSIDDIMDELESFDYDTDAELIPWLKEKITESDYDDAAKKITDILEREQ